MSQQVQAKASVGAKELTAMMTLFVASSVFLNYPQYAAESGLEAGWMVPLISGVLTLVLFLIVEGVLRRYFPGLDIVEVTKRAFGSFAAILVALLIVVYFLIDTATVVREFTADVITTVLPSTPILVVSGLFTVVMCTVAYYGLEGVARLSYFVQPILIIGILGACVLTMNWWHPVQLLPLWGTGPVSVAFAGVRFSSIFINVLLLCVIYPHAHDAGSLRAVGVGSITVATLLLTVFMASLLMVFPAHQATESPFAMYQLGRMIRIGRWVQHVESIFVLMWVMAAVVKMSITLWGAAYILSSAFSWPTFRPIVPGLGLLALSLCLWPEDVAEVGLIDRNYVLSWGWTLVFALPLLIVLLGTLRSTNHREGRRV